MLVISLSGIPHSVGELLTALKDIPAFLASFASIASFWYGHRQWSRRYGLEDGPAILISLGLVFVMLVFVYPLKMVFSALFAWVSAGWRPTWVPGIREATGSAAVLHAHHMGGLVMEVLGKGKRGNKNFNYPNHFHSRLRLPWC